MGQLPLSRIKSSAGAIGGNDYGLTQEYIAPYTPEQIPNSLFTKECS